MLMEREEKGSRSFGKTLYDSCSTSKYKGVNKRSSWAVSTKFCTKWVSRFVDAVVVVLVVAVVRFTLCSMSRHFEAGPSGERERDVFLAVSAARMRDFDDILIPQQLRPSVFQILAITNTPDRLFGHQPHTTFGRKLCVRFGRGPNYF
jgi:hypothetical protein